MNKQKTPTPDILLLGELNFSKAQWNTGIGEVRADNRCNNILQKLINIASQYNFLQYITEGTRGKNILELIFTNNHELITKIHMQPSKITSQIYRM